MTPERFAPGGVGPPLFVVLGSSSTALAVGRRVRDLGGRAMNVATEEHGDIATRSRFWEKKYRSTRGPDALGLLKRIAADHGGVKPLLLATGDEDLWFVSDHRRELDAGFDVLHPANDALATCLDKTRFHRFCEAHGIPTPSWFVSPADPDAIRRVAVSHDLPLVVRLASRSRNRGGFPKMVRLEKAADLDALVDLTANALRPDDELLFSESLLGRDLVRYSVAFCRARAKCLTFEACKERPSAATGDVGTYVTLTDAPEAAALARRSVEALDYYGMGEMEVFLDRASGRHYAIEINARPWIQLGMETFAGTDFLGLLAGTSEGSTATRSPGGAWIDLVGDLYWRHSRSARRSGSASMGPGYLRSLARVRAFKFFALADPAPAIFEAARWLRQAMARRSG